MGSKLNEANNATYQSAKRHASCNHQAVVLDHCSSCIMIMLSPQ